MEFVEIDEDGGYGKTADGKWHLTPLGLAQWMDQEGGAVGLYYHSGTDPFIEAGCGQAIVHQFAAALEAMDRELERIGAEL